MTRWCEKCQKVPTVTFDLYPPLCGVCRTRLVERTTWCQRCEDEPVERKGDVCGPCVVELESYTQAPHTGHTPHAPHTCYTPAMMRAYCVSLMISRAFTAASRTQLGTAIKWLDRARVLREKKV